MKLSTMSLSWLQGIQEGTWTPVAPYTYNVESSRVCVCADLRSEEVRHLQAFVLNARPL